MENDNHVVGFQRRVGGHILMEPVVAVPKLLLYFLLHIFSKASQNLTVKSQS
jgi:hypothetical protein